MPEPVKRPLARWIRCFGAGIIVSSAIFAIDVFWIDILRWVHRDPHLPFDELPEVLKNIQSKLVYIPWFIVGLVLFFGVIKKQIVAPLLFCLGILIPDSIVPVILKYRPIIDDHLHRRSFDSALWKKKTDVLNPVRLRMVDDLLKRHELRGMTKTEVDQLLGVPPETGHFGMYDYAYWLGPERGPVSIDSEWLAIKFENDKVVDFRILRD